MRERVKDIIRLGDRLFSTRFPILSLWQAVSENVHVMRADFTRRRYLSEEFGSYLMSGRPARCHRDLSNAFSAMLRPKDAQWFHAKTDSETVNEDRDAKAWLEWASKTMRRAMYDRNANFVRATKEADGDFCAFGNAVITRDIVDFKHLMYRCWHLRDMAWDENVRQQINTVHFDWRPQARQLVERFRNTKTGAIAANVTELASHHDEQGFKEVQCRRMIVPADEYDLSPQQTRGRPWVSVYVDCENEMILEEMALRTFPVTIPRWATGALMYQNQYGYSPATVYGLPDARMHQQIMLSMLTSAEMATYPAMIAVGEAINGAINLFASGITQADADYDERTGEVLRPITTNFEGIKYGADQMGRLEAALDDAFYLSKIRFPTINKQMTAYEASKLWDDFVRESLPLFEPVEVEYNAHLCDMTFEDLMDHGAFGSVQDMPQALRGRDITWQFDTPITVAAEKALTGSYEAMIQTLVQGGQIDPTVRFEADLHKAARDTISGAGAPAKWLNTEDQAKALAKQEQQQKAAQDAAEQVAHRADVATRVGTAAKSAGEAAQALRGTGMV